VILTECNESDVTSVGERLRKMAQRAHVSWWGDTWSVTISIGATPVQDMDTSGGMVSRAEEGMRKGSGTGGNQVVVVTH
jgi:GGDEF domain-containing protein